MSNKPTVLLTSPIHPDWQAELARHCDVVVAPDGLPATIARLIADADGLIVRSQLAPDIFDHAPRLRAVVRSSATSSRHSSRTPSSGSIG